jgi:PilZ domain
MDKNMQSDQRKHERFNFPYTIECLDPYSPDKIIRGIAMNISESGLCLYIPQSLNKGQEITIRSIIYNYPQKATVCWSEAYDDLYYRIGCCLQNIC